MLACYRTRSCWVTEIYSRHKRHRARLYQTLQSEVCHRGEIKAQPVGLLQCCQSLVTNLNETFKTEKMTKVNVCFVPKSQNVKAF